MLVPRKTSALAGERRNPQPIITERSRRWISIGALPSCSLTLRASGQGEAPTGRNHSHPRRRPVPTMWTICQEAAVVPDYERKMRTAWRALACRLHLAAHRAQPGRPGMDKRSKCQQSSITFVSERILFRNSGQRSPSFESRHELRIRAIVTKAINQSPALQPHFSV
jgi:hypothetical protein